MSGRCDFYRGASVKCGACGTRQDFAQPSHGPDMLARQAGWTIEWRAQPFVRCPKCRPAISLATIQEGGADFSPLRPSVVRPDKEPETDCGGGA